MNKRLMIIFSMIVFGYIGIPNAFASKLSSPVEVSLEANVQSDGLIHVVASIRNLAEVTDVQVKLLEPDTALRVAGDTVMTYKSLARQNGWLSVLEATYDSAVRAGQQLSWKVIVTGVVSGIAFSKIAYIQYPASNIPAQKTTHFKHGYNVAPSRSPKSE